MDKSAIKTFSAEKVLQKDRNNINEAKPEQNENNYGFVNSGAIKWHKQRKKWIGDPSNKPHRVLRDPIISWSTAYKDLLSTNKPFVQPIALAEMVDFLVDVWYDEELSD